MKFLRWLRRLFKKPAPPQASQPKGEWREEWEAILIAFYSSTRFPNIRKEFGLNSENFIRFMKTLSLVESGWVITCRYVETGLGKDRVTGEQNTSEGLFQLSYQDSIYHGAKFDWEIDKSKYPTDPSRTIFKPLNQIEAAMIILEKQLAKGKGLITDGDYYWSTLNKNRPQYQKFKATLEKFAKEGMNE